MTTFLHVSVWIGPALLHLARVKEIDTDFQSVFPNVCFVVQLHYRSEGFSRRALGSYTHKFPICGAALPTDLSELRLCPSELRLCPSELRL